MAIDGDSAAFFGQIVPILMSLFRVFFLSYCLLCFPDAIFQLGCCLIAVFFFPRASFHRIACLFSLGSQFRLPWPTMIQNNLWAFLSLWCWRLPKRILQFLLLLFHLRSTFDVASLSPMIWTSIATAIASTLVVYVSQFSVSLVAELDFLWE